MLGTEILPTDQAIMAGVDVNDQLVRCNNMPNIGGRPLQKVAPQRGGIGRGLVHVPFAGRLFGSGVQGYNSNTVTGQRERILDRWGCTFHTYCAMLMHNRFSIGGALALDKSMPFFCPMASRKSCRGGGLTCYTVPCLVGAVEHKPLCLFAYGLHLALLTLDGVFQDAVDFCHNFSSPHAHGGLPSATYAARSSPRT